MTARRIMGTVIALAWAGLVPHMAVAAHAQTPSEDDALQTAEGVVNQLYELVTIEAGHSPDWDQVRSLFLDQAVIVLRTSRTATTVFSVDGFVNDFVSFIERANVQETGFTERVLRTKPTVFGDMAHVWVLYAASIPGSPRPPQQGVDSFSLIKQDGRWWIAAVTNEIPTATRPVPPPLQE
ncbi:MAG TPA: hypothetical protein VK845_15930 [Gemmatimonadales bacterium]|nr:hypothetical protein [Gemmatimonadales bacterium]